MAEFSLSDMPWLMTQPEPSPSEALLRGAQVGTGIAQTNLSRQRLAIEQAQEERARALAPLQYLMSQQQARAQSLGLQTALQKKQDDIEAGQAFAEASSSISARLKEPNPNYDQIFADLLDAGAKHPAFGASPEFKSLAGMVDFSAGLKNQREIITERNKSLETRAQVNADSRLAAAQAAAESRLNVAQLNNDTRNAIANATLDLKREEIKSKGLPGSVSEVQFINRHLNTILSNLQNAPGSEGFTTQQLTGQATTILQTLFRTRFAQAPPEKAGTTPAPAAAPAAAPTPLTAPPSSTTIQKLDTDPLGLFK